MGVGRTGPTGVALAEAYDPDAMKPKNNLADIHSKVSALANLGLTATAEELNLLDGKVAGNLALRFQRVAIVITDGAAAGTFTPVSGSCVLQISAETPVAVPGTPTTTNLRLGSSANGQQFVADVDVKAAGGLLLTLVAAARLAASNDAAWHYTVASSGGTASAQDSTVYLNVLYGLTS